MSNIHSVLHSFLACLFSLIGELQSSRPYTSNPNMLQCMGALRVGIPSGSFQAHCNTKPCMNAWCHGDSNWPVAYIWPLGCLQSKSYCSPWKAEPHSIDLVHETAWHITTTLHSRGNIHSVLNCYALHYMVHNYFVTDLCQTPLYRCNGRTIGRWIACSKCSPHNHHRQ